ncbi:isocitrate lyase/phosphoenolpyruvate mutase family protein [Pararhizobium sp. BT-229]|uniref:isocitrate lyase/PEP mutase family protein n=1 Tax=Pararhizobium sp. BT-229 TaxID=2986923 RepID=UPI0021F74AED|nr:isocitrate lyase/phosphoenolpyruvate mutase family protein [Pararhizobium sp. BT-229]MCV9962477.1 isocitrate lyase/phosphoenolpyruvate mutase family protein [Pararhizobium sp. BT-229]
MNQTDKAKAFTELHRKGDPVVLYNIWDAGSAKAVAEAGAKALATGSWSVAAANGYGDGQEIPMLQLVDIARAIVAATDLPVSIDFEGGYAEDAEAAALNVARVVDAGAVGINFEDQVVGGSGLYALEAQAARIKAIRAMADARGVPFFINARTDLFLKVSDPARHPPLVEEAIERGAAYAEAGASGFFVPGLSNPDLIGRVCEAVGLPVNIMMRQGVPDVKTLAGLGVGRVSYGPGPYRAMIEWLKGEASGVYQRG